MEKFYEMSVGAGDLKKYNLLKNINIATYVISFFALVMTGVLGGVIAFLVLSLPTFILKRKAYAEYDYEFNSGELTISAVYEKQRRKKIGDIALNQIEIMAPIDSEDARKFSDAQVKKCYNDVKEGQMEYSIVVKWETKRVAYHVAIDKQMLDLCFFANPQNVKRRYY